MIKLLKVLVWVGITSIVLLVLANLWIVRTTEQQIIVQVNNVSDGQTALVLGTSRLNREGEKNQFFENRIDAAAELFHSGRVNHIILSGDNRSKYYNEPKDMLNSLMERGVPSSIVTLDYAGLRTYDSILRAKEVFGQKRLVVVTQRFHCHRALFIANFFGLQAEGFVAADPVDNSNKVLIRELFARPLSILDLYIWNKNPKVIK
ncbi:MAG: YdcF family protein [Cyclobacteriaceae bacterium]